MERRRIFTPIQIGGIELPNRLIMAAMETGFSNESNSLINENVINYFRLRAKGHPGLIIVGGGMIDPDNRAMRDMINICDDTCLEGLTKLVDAIHREGTKCFIQLLHPGADAPSSLFEGIGPVAPSPVMSNLVREMPHELTIEEIQHIEELYGKAVARAKAAGFDGVEICTNSGYLQSQFLAAATNKRTDKYGGDLNGRMTFLKETIEAIKSEVGKDYPLSIRLGGNDLVKDGNTLDDAVEIAKMVEAAGVSMISVTGGWHEASVPQVTPDVPAGTYFFFGNRIKDAVSIPVTQSNRMNPKLAEELVEEGTMDMITLARPFLADPLLVQKAEAGDYDSIRPCIACNQGCLDNLMKHKSIKCMVNATVGNEDKYVKDGVAIEDIQSENPCNILVIGAGVAGLEFARVAAKRGNQVTIWEKSVNLGGQVNLASVPSGKATFANIIDYLADACLLEGVQIALGFQASLENVKEALESGQFDKVVFATGASPIVPSIEQSPNCKVVQAWDVLSGKETTGKNVVVIGGGAVGVETAIHLASKGTLTSEQFAFLYKNRVETPEYLESLLYKGSKSVSIVEMTPKIGKDIGITTKWIAMSNLKKYGISQYKNSKVLKITEAGIEFEYVGPRNEDAVPEMKSIEADTVVLAIGSKPNSSIYEELKDDERVYNIGDSNKIAKIIDAIHAAYDLAAKL